ncbi:MAG TPA: helix-turn-helix domain-containing protein [Pyrinomonadaceae bacterium]|nr:helix-turn-helix domain-containing protein [Pyrinomonadaceae bacterium]
MSRKFPNLIEAAGASPDSDAVSAVLQFLAQRGQLMTPDQCAAFLQIEVGTLYVMKHQRRIPYRKVGHLLRFDLAEIIEWTKQKSE